MKKIILRNNKIIYRSSRSLSIAIMFALRSFSSRINQRDWSHLGISNQCSSAYQAWWQCLRRRPEQLIRHKNGRNLKTRSDETNVRTNSRLLLYLCAECTLDIASLFSIASGTSFGETGNADQYTTCPNKWICD